MVDNGFSYCFTFRTELLLTKTIKKKLFSIVEIQLKCYKIQILNDKHNLKNLHLIRNVALATKLV